MDIMINPRLPNGDAQDGVRELQPRGKNNRTYQQTRLSQVFKKQKYSKMVRGHQTRRNMKTSSKLKRSRKKILTKKSIKKDTKSDEEAGPVTREDLEDYFKKKNN